jgi:hypothetical protein
VSPDDRLQEIIESKDPEAALAACQKHGYSEGWCIIDGALVVYDLDAPPAWLAPVLARRDEVLEALDGDTDIVGVDLFREPTEEEAARGIAGKLIEREASLA